VQKDLFTGLNPEQQRAVEKTDGPLLILAGAGSGKTKTLTHRIAYIIDRAQAKPSEILAVTFTNKAAREMRERVADLLHDNADHRGFMPYMGTFHSICVRLLRQDGEYIGSWTFPRQKTGIVQTFFSILLDALRLFSELRVAHEHRQQKIIHQSHLL
jgi:superfamily I DNA/RNA helicase